MPTGRKIYIDELEDIAIVGLARIRVGGSEGDVTSNGICWLPLDENGESGPLEVGAERTS
jgi:hypothetical protein